MSEEIITPKIENGTMNLMGMQMKISDIIGDKLVDQFIATISPEQMESISKVLFDEVFETVSREEYDDSEKKYKRIQSVQFKKEAKRDSYSSWSRTEYTTVYERAKSTVSSLYGEMIEEKVKEYIASDEYKEKAEKIAKTIVDYALEGYKDDVIKSVRERLVLPVVYPITPEKKLEGEIQSAINCLQGQIQNCYGTINNMRK